MRTSVPRDKDAVRLSRELLQPLRYYDHRYVKYGASLSPPRFSSRMYGFDFTFTSFGIRNIHTLIFAPLVEGSRIAPPREHNIFLPFAAAPKCRPALYICLFHESVSVGGGVFKQMEKHNEANLAKKRPF